VNTAPTEKARPCSGPTSSCSAQDVPKLPKPLSVGAQLNVTGFTVSTFTAKDGGTGVFYEADTVEPAKIVKETA
jgi:hypothetical protein